MSALDEVYQLMSQGHSRRALRKVYDSLYALAQEGKFEELDREIASADLGRLQTRHMVGILLVTRPHRDRLASWRPLYDRCRAACVERHASQDMAEKLFGPIGREGE